MITVNNHWWAHCEHHEEVREGEVNNQEVGWGSKRFGRREHVDDDIVADHRDASQDENNKAQNRMPKRIHRRKLIPMRIDKMQHFHWHHVDDS